MFSVSFGAGYWRKGKTIYEHENQVHDEQVGEPRVIRDFLPSPSELAFPVNGVKITITLSQTSVDFFKSEAAKADTQYQRMIRRLLDAYVEAHADAALPGSVAGPGRSG